MRITVVGAGYVGLVSAACFSEFGFDVACVDKDERKISSLLAGRIPIYEPGLERLVEENVAAGRLTFETDLAEHVPHSDVVFIAVGTPTRRGEDAADLSFVRAAAKEIVTLIDGFTVIVTKSTVPVGTASELRQLMRETRPDADFEVASNPEFLREGSAVEDFLRPDRVVVGVSSDRAKMPIRQIYRPLSIRDVPVVFTTCEAAEVTKYAANTFLATRIAFVNQLADLCEAVGADIVDVARGMGLDHRIGQQYLQPGPGFGGSCFPKDTRALMSVARDVGTPMTIVEEVVEANERRKADLVDWIVRSMGGNVSDKKIAVLGIAFKADTDDVRDASSLTILPGLQEAGARLAIYDPAAMETGKQHFSDVEWCADSYAAAEDADAVLVLTEWNEFRGLDLNRLGSVMKTALLVDTRNIFSHFDIEDSAFEYHAIGRPVFRGSKRSGPKLVADKVS